MSPMCTDFIQDFGFGYSSLNVLSPPPYLIVAFTLFVFIFSVLGLLFPSGPLSFIVIIPFYSVAPLIFSPVPFVFFLSLAHTEIIWIVQVFLYNEIC